MVRSRHVGQRARTTLGTAAVLATLLGAVSAGMASRSRVAGAPIAGNAPHATRVSLGAGRSLEHRDPFPALMPTPTPTPTPAPVAVPPPPPPPSAGDLAARTLTCTVTPGSPALRIPTAAAPLRIWGGGDSVFGFVALNLAARAADLGVLAAHGEYKTSSGLTRPDFFDWPARIRQAVAQYDPEVVVFMAGGNDLQAVAGHGHNWGTPGWSADYADAVSGIIASLTARGVQVYWLGMPRMRDAAFDTAMQTVDAAIRAGVAGRPGAAYCDTVPFLTDAQGRFVQLYRAPDGIHLQPFAGNALAAALLRDIARRAA